MAQKKPREGQTVRRDGRDYTYRNGRFTDSSGFTVTDLVLLNALLSDCGCEPGSGNHSDGHTAEYDSGDGGSGGDSGGGGDGGGGGGGD